MTLNQYQKEAKKTAIYKTDIQKFICLHFGLTGETGEFMEKIKKVYRDDNGIIKPEVKQYITKELGDILWYLSQLCEYYGVSMCEVAKENIKKLKDRKKRDKINGKGDFR